jgi:hypothetical protein
VLLATGEAACGCSVHTQRDSLRELLGVCFEWFTAFSVSGSTCAAHLCLVIVSLSVSSLWHQQQCRKLLAAEQEHPDLAV